MNLVLIHVTVELDWINCADKINLILPTVTKLCLKNKIMFKKQNYV